MKQDLIKLMKRIEDIALGLEGADPPMDATIKAIKKLFVLHQPPPEEVHCYRERTDAAIKSLESMWGAQFSPPKLGTTDDEIKKASQKLYARVFLEGADNKCCHILKAKFKNDYLASGGKESFPETLDEMTELLIGYQDPSWTPPTNPRVRQEESNQTSFHQQGNQDDDDISDYEEVSDTQSHTSHPNTRVRGRGIFSSFT